MPLTDVTGTCQDSEGSWPVTFSVEVTQSSIQYAPAKVIGEVHPNGTRNALEYQRPVPMIVGGSAAFAAAGQPASARQPATLTWSTTTTRTITERLQPGESSWIEGQEPRLTGTGTFTITDQDGNKVVIQGVFECTDPDKSYRLYQRTAPLTATEMEQIRQQRPGASTPAGPGVTG
ncbi:hypothetical protein ACFYZT_32125 [Streptomyces sp. NPDC001591]|uniref:hypothetical protein n=1 Tax=Streptomyces sp. NPDC001591 TaxID=3364589 RepID=UPI00369A418C